MFKKYLSIAPKTVYMPDYNLKPETDWFGINALWFEGAEYKGNKTRVFAHIGYPENSENKKVPAVVLVHGGGGHAYAEWIKIWNERGYAALALDLRGFLPSSQQKGLVGKEEQRDEFFERWQETDGFVAGPEGYDVFSKTENIENVWLYHAVANTILAYNVLLADERIDSQKIGITGISWGGVTTSQVIAHDKRFAFAIPIYGSGFLQYSLAKIMEPFKHDLALNYWNVEEKYKEISFPVLWLCWNSDTCFDVIPNGLSYLATKNAGAVLSVCDKMNHAHWCGWVREESYRFADSVIFGTEKLVRFKCDNYDFFTEKFELECDVAVRNIEATVFYTTEEYIYNEESNPAFEWKTVKALIENNFVCAKIPQDAKSYYIELKETLNGKEYVTTSVLYKR